MSGAAQAVMAELGRTEALELLTAARVGRVVFTDMALPAVRPVNFAVCRGDVVFRVAAESRLATALDKAVVAFEADDLDACGRAGWSVVVTGLAELVEPGDEFDYLAARLPEPWAPGPHECVVRIRTELVTGRRITRLAG
ncbi:pyridoxamine 5'-phosphate oxidase family protein [Yinghuangia soli]|uniref:Pyridoxamine 5'-phosphate oxidase family protein n=1 Tax=Yinghuangia soli TaxID=2908204 RepID=A0AA41Q8G6_9ACTN|nr:pyridoxamine 5'-phosphate oxidase family protein [Yinghuangia soli]MCF2533167.1 pyridoxamine 5'-phosphate oxidase family protein [Yinghuangia soli]